MLAVMGMLVPGAIAVYMPAYSLSFVYVGLVGRPGVAFLGRRDQAAV
jgi:hypothetical protein